MHLHFHVLYNHKRHYRAVICASERVRNAFLSANFYACMSMSAAPTAMNPMLIFIKKIKRFRWTLAARVHFRWMYRREPHADSFPAAGIQPAVFCFLLVARKRAHQPHTWIITVTASAYSPPLTYTRTYRSFSTYSLSRYSIIAFLGLPEHNSRKLGPYSVCKMAMKLTFLEILHLQLRGLHTR